MPIIELYTCFAEIILLWFFFSRFFSNTKLKNQVIFLISVSIVDILGTFFLSLPIRISLIIAVIFCSYFLFFHNRNINLFYAILLFFTTSIIADVICGLPLPYININTQYIISNPFGRLIYNSAAKLTHLILLLIIIHFSKKHSRPFISSKAIALLFCHLASIFMFYVNFRLLMSGGNHILLTVSSIFLLYINIVICFYIEYIHKNFEEHEKRVLLEHQLQLNHQFYHEILHRQEETRALWHDIKKYMIAMETLVNSKNIPKAKEEFSKVESAFNQIKDTVDSGNPIIDGILNHEIILAHQNKINVKLNIWIDREINLSATDLYVILGNTIDNAIEACCNLEVTTDRIISITLTQQAHILLYEIRNPYNKYFTTHKNKHFHGYGLENVKKCVNNNQGTMTIKDSDNFYTVSIIINI